MTMTRIEEVEGRIAALQAIIKAPPSIAEFQAALKEQDQLKAEWAALKGVEDPKKPKRKSKTAPAFGPASGSSDGKGTAVASEAIVRCIADVDAVAVQWLWPGRIAKGKLTLIAGDPGLGKSQITAALAGIVTRGGTWPVDGSRCEPGGVLFVSAEDGVADTIRPRLEAAGADIRQCHILDGMDCVNEKGDRFTRPFTLSREDLHKLYTRILAIGNIKLVVIDPISAFMGGVDSYKNADVRGLLSPMGNIAESCGCAFVGVAHLNKSSTQEALQRINGSLAFVAAARAAMVVVKDKKNPGRRMMLPLKNNLAKEGVGFAFAIESATLENGLESSKIVWEDAPVSITADEAMRVDAVAEKGGALGEAQQFLEALLANGPIKGKEAQAACLEAGVAKITLQRAKEALGVESYKDGGGAWFWRLPKFINAENSFTPDKHDKHDKHSIPSGSQTEATADSVEVSQLSQVYQLSHHDGGTIKFALSPPLPVLIAGAECSPQDTVVSL